MHEERGMSYRKITKWLNRSGIKTHQGKEWGVSGNSVYSVLKRMKERDYRLGTIRKFKTQSEITDFKVYKLKRRGEKLGDYKDQFSSLYL